MPRTAETAWNPNTSRLAHQIVLEDRVHDSFFNTPPHFEEIVMNNFRAVFAASLFVAITFLVTSLTQAQATRTWVSGVGDDVNPCSRTAPCKTFAGAISKTATGGEINVLDSGGFGAVTITKSITIDGTGNLGSILAPATTGININITSASDTAKSVRIRGLTINGAGSGIHGIRVIAADKLSIEDSVIDGFNTNGVTVQAGTVFVRNTVIRNNAGAGISVAPGGAQAALSDSSVIFNGTGLGGPAGSVVSFSNVVLFGNKSGDPAQPMRR
jgi:hypothetical protein